MGVRRLMDEGRRRTAARVAASASALALLSGLGPLAGPAQPAAAAAGCRTPVVKPAGPFTIQSDHRTVKDSGGNVYVPYGTTVPGLADPGFTKDPGSFVTNVVTKKDIPKIGATAGAWCGNTVRLQVSQYDVTADGSTCDTKFLDEALGREVRAAESKGMVAVINDTTESDPAANTEKDPTTATFTFWNCVARHAEDWAGGVAYRQDPQVIFDVFNEPRADNCSRGDGGRGPDGPYDMNLWRNGGTFTGCGQANVKYQGMDAVVYHIRQDGATNMLWAEGPGNGNTLAGLTPGSGTSYLIHDSLNKVVYAFHHPYVSAKNPAGSATWWKEFGYLIDHPSATGVAPVVAGEWTNVAASAAHPAPYCWANAPASVPAFLGYLQKLGVGLSAYELSPGYLITVNDGWTDTTNYRGWTPSDCTSIRQPARGAGYDIRSWFQSRN